MLQIKEQREARNVMYGRDCLRECHSSRHERNNAENHCDTLSAISFIGSMGVFVESLSV